MGKDSVMQNSFSAAVVEVITKGSAGLDNQDASKTGNDNKKDATLSDLFSGNKDAMDLFLAFCFMVQRINTGGLNINALNALHNVKTKLVDNHQLAPGTLEFIISAINSNTDMYRLFAKGSPEFAYVQRQLPVSYSDIMAKNISNKSGFLLELQFTGDLEKDLKTIQSLLGIFLKSHTTDILAIASKDFSFEPINPWSVIHKSIKGELEASENTVIVTFAHPQDQASSLFAVKSIVTIKNWLLRRIPIASDVAEENEIKERPTAQDEMLDRKAFLGISPDFVSFSGNRPYSAKAPNSRVIEVRDVEEEHEENDNTQMDLEQADIKTGKVRGLFGKTKGFMKYLKITTDESEDVGEPSVVEAEEHDGYTIQLVDYKGDIQTFFDLVWVFTVEEVEDELLKKFYQQIFVGCTKAAPSPIKINVKDSIRGRWIDVAQGYLMISNYQVNKEQG